MNERRTSSILQRVPVILAVTAASYGLQLPASVARLGNQGLTGPVVSSQPSGPAVPARQSENRRA